MMEVGRSEERIFERGGKGCINKRTQEFFCFSYRTSLVCPVNSRTRRSPHPDGLASSGLPAGEHHHRLTTPTALLYQTMVSFGPFKTPPSFCLSRANSHPHILSLDDVEQPARKLSLPTSSTDTAPSFPLPSEDLVSLAGHGVDTNLGDVPNIKSDRALDEASVPNLVCLTGRQEASVCSKTARELKASQPIGWASRLLEIFIRRQRRKSRQRMKLIFVSSCSGFVAQWAPLLPSPRLRIHLSGQDWREEPQLRIPQSPDSMGRSILKNVRGRTKVRSFSGEKLQLQARKLAPLTPDPISSHLPARRRGKKRKGAKNGRRRIQETLKDDQR
jgi:hypothetical protein